MGGNAFGEQIRYVAIGDSFTEGYGDERDDGTPRGWADLVAQGLALASTEPVSYANLAIRGRKLGPIVDEQLEPALALEPTLITYNGGGNDMLRPRTSISHIADAFSQVLRRCDEEGVQLILLSGANPSAQLPLSRLIQRRGGTVRHDAVAWGYARAADRRGVRLRADLALRVSLPRLPPCPFSCPCSRHPVSARFVLSPNAARKKRGGRPPLRLHAASRLRAGR